MVIRRAKIEDYQALCRLYQEGDELHRRALPEVFRRPKGPARGKAFLEGQLSNENAAIFVAEEKNDLVGLVHLFLTESKNIPIMLPRKLVFIDNLIVKKEFRSKGLGRRLTDEAEGWAREKGASLLELNVWEFNQNAREFYEHLGFRTAARKMWKKL